MMYIEFKNISGKLISFYWKIFIDDHYLEEFEKDITVIYLRSTDGDFIPYTFNEPYIKVKETIESFLSVYENEKNKY